MANAGTAKTVAEQTLTGATTGVSDQITYDPTLVATDDKQLIDSSLGQVVGDLTLQPAQSGIAVAQTAPQTATSTVGVDTATPQVQQVANATQTMQGTVTAPAQAATVDPRDTAVSGVEAATLDQAQTVQAPAQMQVGAGELVEGSSVDMSKVEQMAQQTKAEAAQGMVSEAGTVQGQMANLMAQFDASEPPAWAAGALRSANAAMAARGLSASSMAGQAIIQAAMESALPIASADAQTIASFEAQNLSNRQQTAMLAAQQRAQFLGQEFDQNFQARVQNASRIADIANQNFSAEVQIALENSRMAQSVDLANLSNRQAVQMAEIAQIATLETTNLNNLQQAAVQNAQNFLQMDLANLDNAQQTEVFKRQSVIQSLLTDTAARNAAAQFNATSQNQANQFYANLATQVSQTNAVQANAVMQFNADQANTVARFAEEINNQRDQFNAANQLIIAQANAKWFQDVATTDTAAINYANIQNAQNMLQFSNTAMNNMYQEYRDVLEQAWKSGESDLDRSVELAVAKMNNDSSLAVASKEASAAKASTLGSWVRDLVGNIFD